MLKRFEGRDEPILLPDLPIIDAHHHLFDRPALRYMFEDFLKDARAGHRIVSSVYVETQAFMRADGPEPLRPLGEIEFANGVAAMSASGRYGDLRACAAIVGHADLRLGDAIVPLLERALSAAPERLRGMRQVVMDHPSDEAYRFFFSGRPPQGIYQHPLFRTGLRQLGAHGLSFEATGFHLQLPAIAGLADAFPDMVFILNNLIVAMGYGLDTDGRAALFTQWRNGLRDIAQRPNVVCKVGGLGLPMWGFGFEERSDPIGYRELAETWRPYVEAAIEAFGTGRCMFQSNYPPDSRSCGYVPLWNAFKHIAAGFSDAEKADLFHATAERIYRPDLPWGTMRTAKRN